MWVSPYWENKWKNHMKMIFLPKLRMLLKRPHSCHKMLRNRCVILCQVYAECVSAAQSYVILFSSRSDLGTCRRALVGDITILGTTPWSWSDDDRHRAGWSRPLALPMKNDAMRFNQVATAAAQWETFLPSDYVKWQNDSDWKIHFSRCLVFSPDVVSEQKAPCAFGFLRCCLTQRLLVPQPLHKQTSPQHNCMFYHIIFI